MILILIIVIIIYIEQPFVAQAFLKFIITLSQTTKCVDSR